jgi:type I restriction enzyme, S subunit
MIWIAPSEKDTDHAALEKRLRASAELERRMSVVEESGSVVSANLQRAVRLRQSVLQKAFNGEPV